MNPYKLTSSNDSVFQEIKQRFTEEDYLDLKSSGLSDKDILKSGHFSVRTAKEAKEIAGIAHRGLCFRYQSPKGDLYTNSAGKPWYRVKPRDISKKNMYDDIPKYLSQKGEGCRPYFSAIYSGNWEMILSHAKTPIWITEGEKKADLACSLGIACIGLGGVSSWQDSRFSDDTEDDEDKDDKKESVAIPELEKINWRDRKVVIAFDSDITYKLSVRKQLKSLALWLHKKGADVYVLPLPNEVNGDKNGVDDFVVRHGAIALKALERQIIPALQKAKGGWDLNLPKDPNLPIKSAMCSTVLKTDWAFRKGIGWYRFNGKIWRYYPNDGNSQCPELEGDILDFMDSQGWQAQSSNSLGSIIRHLRTKLLIPGEQWNPADKLAFSNGTLNLKTGEFIAEHAREDYLTNILPYEYQPNADCPRWEEFISQTVDNDREAIEFIRAILKWILIPKATDRNAEIQKSLFIVGKPGTGKGTFLDVITWLVGEENAAALSTETFKQPAMLSSLLDSKVAIDRDATGYLENVGIFNKIVSNEPIELKKLWKDYIKARIGTIIIQAANNFLDVPTTSSDGLMRRVLAISFDRQPKEVDLNLGEKLQSELPGIFTWAWQMPVSEMKRRILWAGNIPLVRLASIRRFEDSCPEFSYLLEKYPGGGEAKPRELYKDFKLWADETGRSGMQERKFYKAIQRLGCELTQKTGGYRFYQIPKMTEFDPIEFMGLAKAVVDVDASPIPSPTPIVEQPIVDEENVEEELDDETIQSLADHVAALIDSPGIVAPKEIIESLKPLSKSEKEAVWNLFSDAHKQVIKEYAANLVSSDAVALRVDLNLPNVVKPTFVAADGYEGAFAVGDEVEVRKADKGDQVTLKRVGVEMGDRLILKRYLGIGDWLCDRNGEEKRLAHRLFKKVKDEPTPDTEPSLFDVPVSDSGKVECHSGEPSPEQEAALNQFAIQFEEGDRLISAKYSGAIPFTVKKVEDGTVTVIWDYSPSHNDEEERKRTHKYKIDELYKWQVAKFSDAIAKRTVFDLKPGDRVKNKNGFPATFLRLANSMAFIQYDGHPRECCVGFLDIKPLLPEQDPRTAALQLFNSLQEGVILKALRHKDHRGFTGKKGVLSFFKERYGLFYAGVMLLDESLDEETRKVVFNLSAVEVCK